MWPEGHIAGRPAKWHSIGRNCADRALPRFWGPVWLVFCPVAPSGLPMCSWGSQLDLSRKQGTERTSMTAPHRGPDSLGTSAHSRFLSAPSSLAQSRCSGRTEGMRKSSAQQAGMPSALARLCHQSGFLPEMGCSLPTTRVQKCIVSSLLWDCPISLTHRFPFNRTNIFPLALVQPPGTTQNRRTFFTSFNPQLGAPSPPQSASASSPVSPFPRALPPAVLTLHLCSPCAGLNCATPHLPPAKFIC